MRLKQSLRAAGAPAALALLTVVFSGLADARAAMAQEPASPGRPSRLSEIDFAPLSRALVDELEPAVARQLTQGREAVVSAVSQGRESDGVESFGRLCLLYLRYDLLPAAEPCLARMRQLEPRDYRWPYYELLLHTRTGAGERAFAAAELTLALRGDDAPTLVRYGDLMLESGDMVAAREAYEKVLAARPEDTGALFGLGRLAAAAGNNDEAVELLGAALRGQPEGSIIHHHLGLAYRAAGDREMARAELAKNRQRGVVWDDPLLDELLAVGTSSEETLAGGVDALQAGRSREAAAAFRQVLASRPDDAEAHYNLALALIDSEDLSGAERHLRRAVELQPDYGAAHFNLAILLGRTARPAEARPHLERAAASDPDNLAWRLVWARSLADAGELGPAVDELRQVTARDPGFAEAQVVLASMLAGQGSFSEAASHFLAVTELTPADPQGWFGLSLSRLRAGAYAEGAQALEAAVARFPEDPIFGNLLARVLATCPLDSVRDGRRAVTLAEKVVERQLTLDHGETLAMALAEVGRFDEAIAWQRRVIDQERSSQGSVSPEREARLASYEAGRAIRAEWN
jgi:tetratricopeptide (TPR) repeat protein